MIGSEGEVRLAVWGAASHHLTQIQAWTAGFRKRAARVEAVSEMGQDSVDLYLVVIEETSTPANETANELHALVAQMGLTPCLVLATRDDDTWADAALAAGAVDFLVWDHIDAPRLERAVQFGLRRRDLLGAVTARASYLAEARERDWLQLANALHDGPLQDLIGARFLLGALKADGSVDDIQSSLQSVIQAVRALCSELKPPALGPFGLEKAIRAHLQGFQARHPDTAVTLELDVDHLLLPEWARLALFRIFQAALSNVERHAHATQVWVRLRLEDEQVRLTVADDGQGFEVPGNWLDFAQTDRCGLLLMQERADALGGRLVVQSTAGSGTRVMVQVPLHQPPVPLPKFLASTAPDHAAPDKKRASRL